jgi:hypothetical protein
VSNVGVLPNITLRIAHPLEDQHHGVSKILKQLVIDFLKFIKLIFFSFFSTLNWVGRVGFFFSNFFSLSDCVRIFFFFFLPDWVQVFFSYPIGFGFFFYPIGFGFFFYPIGFGFGFFFFIRSGSDYFFFF